MRRSRPGEAPALARLLRVGEIDPELARRLARAGLGVQPGAFRRDAVVAREERGAEVAGESATSGRPCTLLTAAPGSITRTNTPSSPRRPATSAHVACTTSREPNIEPVARTGTRQPRQERRSFQREPNTAAAAGRAASASSSSHGW